MIETGVQHVKRQFSHLELENYMLDRGKVLFVGAL
jgi:hypothetical protein